LADALSPCHCHSLSERKNYEEMAKMTRHIGYIHGSTLEPFSPPCFCQSGVGLEEYTYHYQQGYHQVTGKPYYYYYYYYYHGPAPEEQKSSLLPMAA